MKTTIERHENENSGRFISRLMVAFGATLAAMAGAHAQGGVIAISFTGGSTGNSIREYTVGWEFSTNEPIQIEALGWYDHDSDGLTLSHEIGVWHEGSQTLLTSTSIPAGSSAALVDSFRYVDLASPLALLPGDYVIAGIAVTPADRVVDATTAVTAPGITYLQNRGADTPSATTLIFPEETYPSRENGYFGPNFIFTVVPEPSVYVLLTLGGAVLVMVSRKRR